MTNRLAWDAKELLGTWWKMATAAQIEHIKKSIKQEQIKLPMKTHHLLRSLMLGSLDSCCGQSNAAQLVQVRVYPPFQSTAATSLYNPDPSYLALLRFQWGSSFQKPTAAHHNQSPVFHHSSPCDTLQTSSNTQLLLYLLSSHDLYPVDQGKAAYPSIQ